MKSALLTLTSLALVAGCTTVSLERHTLNQALSVTDMRYQAVLNNLAVLANNCGALPSFALTASGVANVSNMVQAESITLWDRAVHGFSKETLSFLGKHNPDQQWTLDPVVSEPQLAGLRCACLWALYGPPPPDSACVALLRAPQFGEVTGYHLDVARELAAIPPGWLHRGRRRDVPRGACYVGHCHHTYVWVTPDGMEGLSAFTLVLLDIATIDPTSLVLLQPQATVERYLKDKDTTPNSTVTETRPATQQVAVGPDGKLSPGPITVGAAPTGRLPDVGLGDVSTQTPMGRPQGGIVTPPPPPTRPLTR
jgi:hypothetical protein